MEQFGFKREEVIESLDSHTYDHRTATYLLLAKCQNTGAPIMSRQNSHSSMPASPREDPRKQPRLDRRRSAAAVTTASRRSAGAVNGGEGAPGAAAAAAQPSLGSVRREGKWGAPGGGGGGVGERER